MYQKHHHGLVTIACRIIQCRPLIFVLKGHIEGVDVWIGVNNVGERI